MNTDAVIGVVSAVAFAIGLIIISQSSGFNRVIEGMLVGNIFTVTDTELLFSLLVLVGLWDLSSIKTAAVGDLRLEYAKFAKIAINFLVCFRIGRIACRDWCSHDWHFINLFVGDFSNIGRQSILPKLPISAPLRHWTLYHYYDYRNF